MNRFGGADLLSHWGALGGLDARLGACSIAPSVEISAPTLPAGWTRPTTIALHNVLDRGLRPGRE